jgi:hypothetical protein
VKVLPGISKTATATIDPSGHGYETVPLDRPHLAILEGRMKRRLKLRYGAPSDRRHVMGRVATALVTMCSLPATAATGQTEGCEPVSERAGRDFGCFITARQELGALPADSAF